MTKTPEREKMSKKIPTEYIAGRIASVRGSKVMLTTDLSMLYEVEPRVLIQAVKRNSNRFPTDFMFQLSSEEWHDLKSQSVTSSFHGGSRVAPYAFTDYGVAMLSSVLNSKRAIEVNIQIMRAFISAREILASNAELSKRLDNLEKKYDSQFKTVFEAIRQLMTPLADAPKPRIGYQTEQQRRNARR
jgi:hypothetical protein